VNCDARKEREQIDDYREGDAVRKQFVLQP
jgi:hypothetical protein